MHISRFAELINEVYRAACAGAQAQRTTRWFLDAVRERIGQRAALARCQSVIGAGDVARDCCEAACAHTIFVREGILVRRVEDAVTAAQHYFVAELVGESDAGSELLLRRVALMRRRAINSGV